MCLLLGEFLRLSLKLGARDYLEKPFNPDTLQALLIAVLNEYETRKLPFDILAGSSELREHIEAGVTAEEIARSWEPSVGEFARLRERFLIY